MAIAALVVAVFAATSKEPLHAGSAEHRAARTSAQTELDKGGAPQDVVDDDKESADSGSATKPAKVVGSPAKPLKIVVVVSKTNPVRSLKRVELRRIFLRQKTHWPNRWPIAVYERPGKSRIGLAFSKSLFNKKPEELREYWMNLQLTRGLKPPKVLRSAKLVKQYLRRVKGGIGYIYAHEVDDTVRVIEIENQDGDGATQQD